jgi:hypothetical protein
MDATATTARRGTASLLGAAAALAVVATGADRAAVASRQSEAAAVRILLVSPTNGTVVPRYGPSPLFRWRITQAGAAPARGSGRLEVSTSPSFAQSASYRFGCGAAAGRCPQKHRWPATQPYWYDLANSCSDVPPVGSCGRLSRTLYWRVRYEPAGAASRSSPVGVLERAVSADRTPPAVTTVAGSSRLGGTAAVTFFVSDGSGSVRDIVELAAGARVVFGVRTAWTAVARVGGATARSSCRCRRRSGRAATASASPRRTRRTTGRPAAPSTRSPRGRRSDGAARLRA